MNNLTTKSIKDKIYTIRDTQVMLDKDLAQLYGVETKRVNEAVKNNIDKFPSDFYFELSSDEFEILRSKFSSAKFAKTRVVPKVFTEQGIYMLATILKSPIATQASLFIIRTFAQMRHIIANTPFERFERIEQRLNSHDRFLIIDDEMYHFGTSLKDLGKKWFAFSKIDNQSLQILQRLEKGTK